MEPKILIVDDHEIVREGIRNLLARSGKNWLVSGEASNAGEAILAVKSLQRDLVLAVQTLLSGGTFLGGPSEPSPTPKKNPDNGITFFATCPFPRIRPLRTT